MNDSIRKRVERLEVQAGTGGRLEDKIAAFCADSGVDPVRLLKIARERDLEAWLNHEISAEGMVAWPTFCEIRNLCNEVRS